MRTLNQFKYFVAEASPTVKVGTGSPNTIRTPSITDQTPVTLGRPSKKAKGYKKGGAVKRGKKRGKKR